MMLATQPAPHNVSVSQSTPSTPRKRRSNANATSTPESPTKKPRPLSLPFPIKALEMTSGSAASKPVPTPKSFQAHTYEPERQTTEKTIAQTGTAQADFSEQFQRLRSDTDKAYGVFLRSGKNAAETYHPWFIGFASALVEFSDNDLCIASDLSASTMALAYVGCVLFRGRFPAVEKALVEDDMETYWIGGCLSCLSGVVSCVGEADYNNMDGGLT